MISDEVTIKVSGGKGGDGFVSFRREKFVPKGGPDGGDGGRGGDIIFEVDAATHTLSYYAGKKVFRAQDGKSGGKKRQTGKSGSDLHLRVPPGTAIYQINGQDRQVADLISLDQTMTIAKGGIGGWGNVHFATATHQTPTEANPGQEGQKLTIRLELKLIADVGIIGMPNAGKSTLLSHISHAKPKIADYPFTTTTAQLGMVKHHEHTFIVAEIPGLIKDAAKGRGLGYDFLRHAERTRLLIHLIDSLEDAPFKNYQIIRQELTNYQRPLADKEELIVINKSDSLDKSRLTKIMACFKAKIHQPVYLISAATGEGISELLNVIVQKLFSHKNEGT